ESFLRSWTDGIGVPESGWFIALRLLGALQLIQFPLETRHDRDEGFVLGFKVVDLSLSRHEGLDPFQEGNPLRRDHRLLRLLRRCRGGADRRLAGRRRRSDRLRIVGRSDFHLGGLWDCPGPAMHDGIERKHLPKPRLLRHGHGDLFPIRRIEDNIRRPSLSHNPSYFFAFKALFSADRRATMPTRTSFSVSSS